MCARSVTRRSTCLSGEAHPNASPVKHWTEREIDEGAFKDARLGRRFAELLKQISEGRYRFFANGRVEEADILSGHFAATRARYDDCKGPILLIQDTTEFSYQRGNTNVGFTRRVNSLTQELGAHSLCAPASTGLRMTAAIRSRPRWKKLA
jgi:hypothetical protein